MRFFDIRKAFEGYPTPALESDTLRVSDIRKVLQGVRSQRDSNVFLKLYIPSDRVPQAPKTNSFASKSGVAYDASFLFPREAQWKCSAGLKNVPKKNKTGPGGEGVHFVSPIFGKN